MKNLFVVSAVAFLLGTAAAQADSYVSVLGGPTFAPGLNVNGTKNGMDTGFKNTRLQSSSYMGNLVYHLPFDNTPFEIYGGGGLGAVSTNIDNSVGNHGGSTVLGWQALGGVEYRASDQASLFAEYRYQNAHNVNAGGLTQIGNTSNNLSFGVKWHF
jgi:opacity protein-like surface antigen